jgi:hypothetical protein
MRTTITIEEKEYAMDAIRMGASRKFETLSGIDRGVHFIAASMQAAGHEEVTPEYIEANFPAYIDGEPFIAVAMTKAYEANGFKTKLVKPGEALPPVAAAESTSSTSTAA